MSVLFRTQFRTGRADLPVLQQTLAEEKIARMPGLRYWYNGSVGRRSVTSLLDRASKEEGKISGRQLPGVFNSARVANRALLDHDLAGSVPGVRTSARMLPQTEMMMFCAFELVDGSLNQNGQLLYTHSASTASGNRGFPQQLRINPSTGNITCWSKGSSGSGTISTTMTQNTNTAYIIAFGFKAEGGSVTRHIYANQSVTPVTSTSTFDLWDDLVGFGVGPAATGNAKARVADGILFDRFLSQGEVAYVFAAIKEHYGLS